MVLACNEPASHHSAFPSCSLKAGNWRRSWRVPSLHWEMLVLGEGFLRVLPRRGEWMCFVLHWQLQKNALEFRAN